MLLVVGLGLGLPAQKHGAALQQTDLLADERSKPAAERTQLATPEYLKARLREATRRGHASRRTVSLIGEPTFDPCGCYMWSDPHVECCDGNATTFDPSDDAVHTLAQKLHGELPFKMQSYHCPVVQETCEPDYYPCGASAATAFAGSFTDKNGLTHHAVFFGERAILCECLKWPCTYSKFTKNLKCEEVDLGTKGEWSRWPIKIPIGKTGCVLERTANRANLGGDTIKNPGDYETTFGCGGAKLTTWYYDEPHMPTGYLMNALADIPAEDVPFVSGLCHTTHLPQDIQPAYCADPHLNTMWATKPVSEYDVLALLGDVCNNTVPKELPDREAYVWGDPHVVTFNNAEYDYMGRGVTEFCKWEVGGEQMHVDFYGCGVLCDIPPMADGSWACGESSAIGVGVKVFGMKVAVLKSRVFVEAADGFAVDFALTEAGEKARSFDCPKCPSMDGKKGKLTVEIVAETSSDYKTPGDRIDFRFGDGPEACGTNVTFSTWVWELGNGYRRMPNRYLNNGRLRLSEPVARTARGVCHGPDAAAAVVSCPPNALEEGLRCDVEPKPAKDTMGDATAFPSNALYSLAQFDEMCHTNTSAQATFVPDPVKTCENSDVPFNLAGAACTKVMEGEGPIAAMQCAEDFCALHDNAEAANASMEHIFVQNPFGCTFTPSGYCNGDSPIKCYLDPMCGCGGTKEAARRRRLALVALADDDEASSNASATGPPPGFTPTATCQKECHTYAGDWTEKCLWNNSEGNGVHCEGCEQCTGAAAAPVADNSTNATAPTELEKENAELKKKLEAAEKASKNASQTAAPDNATAPENATNAPGDGAGDDKKKRVHG